MFDSARPAKRGKPHTETFYYPQPDGSVRFSSYHTEIDEEGKPLPGHFIHASGYLTGEDAEYWRKTGKRP